MADHSKPVRLARAVLYAAVDNDWPKAQRAFERLADECDADGLGTAILAWCDTVIAHVCGCTWDFRPIKVVPMAIETGALGGEVEPAKQWAFDLIQVRGCGDLDGFRALLAKPPESPMKAREWRNADRRLRENLRAIDSCLSAWAGHEPKTAAVDHLLDARLMLRPPDVMATWPAPECAS